jgi:MFS superfamily sulfate permease-like transporter
VLLIGAIAQGAYLEALYFPSVRFTELGFTEFTQTLVLATCCAMLVYIRQVLKVWPTVTLLLLAFLAASLVREQDHFLDSYVAHNTWKALVALIIIPTLVWVVKQRHRFLDEFAYYSNTFSFGLFTAGVLTTYIFSRLYGRQEFWQTILDDNYVRNFKNIAEEVVELLGYSLMLIATLELLLLARRVYLAHS